MKMLTAEQVVDVLNIDPSRDLAVKREQKRIERRAAELRNDVPFSAYRKARIEWLAKQMEEWKDG